MNNINKIEATIGIPDLDLENYIVDCFEGGSTYWIEQLIVGAGRTSYDFIHEDINIGIRPYESGVHSLHKGMLLDALSTMSREYPKAFNRLLYGDYDSGDTDILLQIALFGEVTYG